MRRLFALDTNDPASELPIGQLKLCIVLRDGSRTTSEVSQELGISLSAATQLADRLERTGLIERACEAEDKRVKLLRLSPLGERVMRERRENRAARVEQAILNISPEARSALMTALDILSEATDSIAPSENTLKLVGEEI